MVLASRLVLKTSPRPDAGFVADVAPRRVSPRAGGPGGSPPDVKRFIERYVGDWYETAEEALTAYPEYVRQRLTDMSNL